jgi:hypothetical protein
MVASMGSAAHAMATGKARIEKMEWNKADLFCATANRDFMGVAQRKGN